MAGTRKYGGLIGAVAKPAEDLVQAKWEATQDGAAGRIVYRQSTGNVGGTKVSGKQVGVAYSFIWVDNVTGFTRESDVFDVSATSVKTGTDVIVLYDNDPLARYNAVVDLTSGNFTASDIGEYATMNNVALADINAHLGGESKITAAPSASKGTNDVVVEAVVNRPGNVVGTSGAPVTNLEVVVRLVDFES